MPHNCAVYGCFNTRTNGLSVRFFKFPRDYIFRKKWIIACCRADEINPNNALICSIHFAEEDYIDDMKARLLHIESPRNKRLLKEHAVPSLNLYNKVSDMVSHANAEDVRRKSRKRHVSQPESSLEVCKEGNKKTKAVGKKLGNTKKKPYKWELNVFLEWLEVNGHSNQFESLSKEELDQLLARLYAEGQNKKGEKLTKTAYTHIRDAIQKHLESSPWNIDYMIKTDDAFLHSNTILEDLGPQNCPLRSCEVEQLVKTGTLGKHNPTALQNLVWISVALHLGELNIGQWTKMTKSSFVHSTDERGMDYIGWSDCRTKSKSEDSFASFSSREHLKIYALPQEPLCPVKAFDMYVSLLNPAADELWQKPNTSYKKNNKWYLKQSAGKRAVLDMMKNMCLQAKLSKHHSNSCLHFTSSTILMEADIQESDIQVSGNQRNIRPSCRKLPREKKGEKWKEESQTHCYEDLVTVNNISSSDIDFTCEDIKIEDEDPFADIPGDDNEIVPLKRCRFSCDGDIDYNLNEENIHQVAHDVSDDPSYQQMTLNPCEDREAETASPALGSEEDSLEMHQTRNFATLQYSQPFIEAQKKDIYDAFAGHIAKTLRDLNEMNTFRRVQIEINNILLDALSGKYKNLEIPEKQVPHVLSNTTDMPESPSTSQSNAQTTVVPENAGNGTQVLCFIYPSNVTQNQVTSEFLLQNSVNTIQTVQSTMNKKRIHVNTVTPPPVILTPNSLNSGSESLTPNPLNPCPVNSVPVMQTPNPVTFGSVIQNPNPVPCESANQDLNPIMRVSVSQDSNPVTSSPIIQNPNPITSGPDIQNPNPVTSGSVLQKLNLATSGPIIQNQNTVIQKPFNLGQLVNNPMNLWQMIKNPQMPKQVVLKPINLRQMSQIVGSMKQTVPQLATAQKQVTSTLTLKSVSKSVSDT